MGKCIKKIWNILTSLLVLLMVALTVVLVGPRLVGLQVYTVLSGSMEPAYPTGSLIYVKEVDAAELEPGDVITFMLSEQATATHRIVEVVPGEDGNLRFRTKGDANEVEDAKLVLDANILGTPVFMIPRLGKLAAYIQTRAGTLRLISVVCLIGLLVILPDLFTKKKET